jgi:phosphotriesterase-related protein
MRFFLDQGVLPGQIVLCHIDKRPDAGLHKELASAGISLEYDTFFREKYNPHENVWPLISRMVADGFADHLCLATDMAEAIYWSNLGKGPGLTAFPTVIRRQLMEIGLDTPTLEKLTGRNIARILAREL